MNFRNICAGNIENHEDFHILIEHFLGGITQGNKSVDLEEDYTMSSGLKIDLDNENYTGLSNSAVVWPIPTWSNPKSYNFFVLSWLLGNSSSFVTGGPGRGMHSRAPQSKFLFL